MPYLSRRQWARKLVTTEKTANGQVTQEEDQVKMQMAQRHNQIVATIVPKTLTMLL